MLRHRLAAGLAAAALVLALPACDSTEPGADGPLAEAFANAGAWTWVDVEGSQCRDGSATGIGVRLQEGAEDLVVYLAGGGACFNGQTCATNPSSYSRADFQAEIAARGNAGMFDTGRASNPVAGFNMVYVPYCTGDVHAGSFPNNTLLGAELGPQQFVGHQNVRRAVDLVAEGLGTPGQVLLTGSSAGGLGALLSFDYTARAFAGSALALVDDSGPIVYADDVLSPQLAGQLVGLYNASAAIQNAPELFQADGLQGLYNLYATRYPEASFGFSSYLGDDVFQAFFGFGQPDPITDAEFAAGLRDLRGRLDDRWGTYYAPGDAHTFLLVPDRFAGTSAGVSYEAWLAGILAGTPTDVDPAAALAAR